MKLTRIINRKLELLSLLEVKSDTGISRDYAKENDEFDAKNFKDDLRLGILCGKI